MAAAAKLDRLWIEWVGYAAVCSLVELLWGSYTGFDAGLRVAVTTAVAWYLVRELKQKSSLVWAFGVVAGIMRAASSAMCLLEALARGSEVDVCLVLVAASGVIHFRTFWVLRDRDVKQHVMSS